MLPAARPEPHRFQRSSRWRSAEFLSLLASASSTSSTTLGILGATVMPHNLYLHSSIVQTRTVKRDPARIRSAIGMSRIDTIASLVIPALIGVQMLGNGAVGQLLVASQVVLSLQLPFALYPLIRMTSDRSLMGEFANTLPTRLLVWTLFVAISAANLWLVAHTVGLAG
ncbi:divalent metal cation transporter [Paraburkholderia sp. MM5496-R1]|uniref:divalent metal cation transporter n=1 Tax=Paraburkholderia sp. MM5496-R1 TaxID=2991065 RepID=UPI003D2118F5